MNTLFFLDNNKNECCTVGVDKSNGSGCIRFGHEISVTFIKKGARWIFSEAWHCGVCEMEFDSTEEDAFEDTFPGLLKEMREHINVCFG